MSTAAELERARLNTLSHRIIGLCIEVHRGLGPGLLESAYEACLAHELELAEITFERQTALALNYKGLPIDCGYRVDFLIEGSLILELKATTELSPIHEAQLLTYLKLMERPLGLLINFNVPILIRGVKRMTHGPLFTGS